MLKVVLFDLDGTLTESGPGIMQGVRYALEQKGMPVPGDDILSQFVGPPLYLSFMRHFHMTEQEAKEMVPLYKAFYDTEGVLINRPYDGIPEALETLCAAKLRLGVASAKPHDLVQKVLDHFDLRKYFSVVQGALDTGRADTKKRSVEAAVKAFSADTDETLMVGDRRDDVDGAGALGIGTVAVRWGYAPPGELEEAGAVAIVETPEELVSYLCAKAR